MPKSDWKKWKPMFMVLKEMGVPAHFIVLLESLYEHNLIAVRTNDEISKVGCILSLQLFKIYIEYIIQKVLENWNGGISIDRRRIFKFRFVNDPTHIDCFGLHISAAKPKSQKIFWFCIDSFEWKRKIRCCKNAESIFR